jgi:hypothetical protein
MCVRYEDKTDALSTALEEKICCAVNAAPNECSVLLLLLLTRSLILLSLSHSTTAAPLQTVWEVVSSLADSL